MSSSETDITPLTSFACEPTSQQIEEEAVKSKRLEEAFVKKATSTADHIFTGTVIDVEDMPSGEFFQKTIIRVQKTIKGNKSEIQSALMGKRNRSNGDEKLYVCGDPRDPEKEEPYALKTYSALFYVRDGVLIRASHFPIGPQPMLPDDEIEFIYKNSLVKREQ